MSQQMQQILFRHRRQTLNGLAVLVPAASDLDPASFLGEVRGQEGEIGFSDPGCASNLKIPLPGPDEAGRSAHLHIEQLYSTRPPNSISHYRFEICWCHDVVLPAPAGDYLRDSMLCLRRGVRFDHHPLTEELRHPQFHWHPNGCSEFRMVSGEMTALKTAAVAFLMFDPKALSDACSTNQQVHNVVEQLYREMPGLPGMT